LDIFNDPVNFLLMSTGRLPALIFALSFHEAAHAWMALKCGDDTAARMGRITLNPLSHLDPIGSIGIVFGFFGWGRPVPYVERNLRNPRRDAMLIAAAGPASNILLALVFGILFRIVFYFIEHSSFESEAAMRVTVFLAFLFSWCVFLNLALCFFNLIPVFPLDGEKILVGLLPYRQAYAYASLRQYGPMGLLLLIFMGGSLVSAFVFVMSAPLCYLFTGVGMYRLLNLIGNLFSVLW
jgi:Zn-dependent protease